MSVVRRDVVIVGRDLSGLILAELAARDGRTVDVIHWKDDRSSLGWIQSGIRDGAWNRRTYSDGVSMLTEHFGYQWRDRRTFVAVPPHAEVMPFATASKTLNGLRRVTHDEVSKWGPFITPGPLYYSVPDVTFPLEELLLVAEARAKVLGVRFRETPVAARTDASATNGYVLAFDDLQLDPRATYVVLGAHSATLAEQLQLPNRYVMERSSVLEVETTLELPDGAITDWGSDVVVSSFPIPGSIARRRLVIRREERAPRLEDPASERTLLLNILPGSISRDVANWVARTTVQCSCTGEQRPGVEPYRPEAFPGLMFATTQQPMFALKNAHRALSLITNTPPRKRKAA